MFLLSYFSSVQIEEWKERAADFNQFVLDFKDVCEKFAMIPNRCLLYDMNDYLWDLRGTIAVLNSYIKWLGNQYFQRRLKGSGIGFGNRSGLAVPMEND